MPNLSSLVPPEREGVNHLLPLDTPSLDQCRSLFPNFQYHQLPTPQSPNNFSPYIGSSAHHSPLHRGPVTPLPSSSDSHQAKTSAETRSSGSLMITPDSSPFNGRYAASMPPHTHSRGVRIASTPEPSTSAVKLEPPSDQITQLAPAPSIFPSSSNLSFAFAPRTPIPGRNLSLRRSTSPLGVEMRMDSPITFPHLSSHPKEPDLPSSSPLEPAAEIFPSHNGGEMERLRQAMLENRLAQIKDAEDRRPDYLKREKRAGMNGGNGELDKSNQHENDRAGAIGITDSPSKGRRLTLFQETSDESFEESLMAGGYGRYRTTEWVRQPQPLALATASVTGPSNVVALLEQAQEPIVPEKDLKRRRRLEAFRGPGVQRSKLLPVELEGRGRVLVDPACDTKPTTCSNDPSPSKRRTSGRRKKKSSNLAVKEERNSLPSAFERRVQKPNWIDHEFPWRLRTEEMAGVRQVEDDGRLKMIEEFLDRDSDDDELQQEYISDDGLQKDVTRRTGGKMVPLPAKTELIKRGLKASSANERKMLPYDPADARTALLAKRSVRSLSYRLQRRGHAVNNDEEDVICICDGANDGRQLVQCDGCDTWYHLQCIGIRNIDELGREEDPWFCHSCTRDELLSSEPTFVPTDEAPRAHRIQDAPFFQPFSPHDSPSWSFQRVPRTPTRRSSDLEPPGLSSGSSWVNSSRHGPSTPQHPHEARVYGYDTATYDHPFEESPFDPASTPSRGIKFGAPFMTPRNTVWSTRPPGLSQTPSKPGGRDLTSSRGGPGSGSDGHQRSGPGFSPFGRFPSFDESPVRRRQESQLPRYPESPLALRSHPPMLEESPIYECNIVIGLLAFLEAAAQFTLYNKNSRDEWAPFLLDRNHMERLTKSDQLRLAVAICSLRFKPEFQSIAAHVLDLRDRFRPCEPCVSDKGSWRSLALKLEGENIQLRAQLDSEKMRCLSLASKCDVSSTRSAPDRDRPWQSKTNASGKNKKTRNKGTINIPPGAEWRAETLSRFEHDDPPSLVTLFPAMDAFSRLLALGPTVPQELITSMTFRTVEAIGDCLDSLLFSSTAHLMRYPKKRLEILNSALQYVLTHGTPLISRLSEGYRRKRKRDEDGLGPQEDPMGNFLALLQSRIFNRIITTTCRLSRVYIGDLLSNDHDRTHKATDSPQETPGDLRADIAFLFESSARLLLTDLPLASGMQGKFCAAKLSALRASLMLATVYELEKAIFGNSVDASAGPLMNVSCDDDSQACRRTNISEGPYNGSGDHHSVHQRIDRLAIKDSVWYLCNIMHILLGGRNSTCNEEPTRQTERGKSSDEVGKNAKGIDDQAVVILLEAAKDILFRLVINCRKEIIVNDGVRDCDSTLNVAIVSNDDAVDINGHATESRSTRRETQENPKGDSGDVRQQIGQDTVSDVDRAVDGKKQVFPSSTRAGNRVTILDEVMYNMILGVVESFVLNAYRDG
ncbi:hypothetical protein APHAL10511_006579 [Amanita phalloides]|nr:hypothetical protein APHAL10511_006579 [Amanita phalloides]